ncbi:hypothetical protein T07_11933 [Trichinella nelsoni]|uniref:Uncharacterized protein n=1 Tax=Trichinella nelsoni TaxID=6336 RepID=A0A0V0SNJ9_9BILA|nr:hypothetical protein T07_11933 [Trichinella nelsoni]
MIEKIFPLFIFSQFYHLYNFQMMPSSVGPKTSVPVLYCLVSKLKDIPYESEIMDDNKRQGIWHSGFRKAVQYDVMRTMFASGLCDRYQYCRVRCFRNENNNVKVVMELSVYAYLDEMENFIQAFRSFQPVTNSYIFDDIEIRQEPSSLCDIC